jgi:hydrogenase 3 maturation protease
MSFLADRWRENLKRLFFSLDQNNLHIFGVGNSLREDDGVGIYLARLLRKKCGSKPVNFCKIHAPSLRVEFMISGIDYGRDEALIFDSVDFGASPGSVILASLSDSRFGFFATHNVPIRELPNVSSHLDRVHILGIQPMDLSVGEGLSSPVNDSVEEVVRVMSRLMGVGT